jgi:hypothetical protein
MAASIASDVIGEGSTPVSFLNSLRSRALNDFAMASRKMFTSSFGVRKIWGSPNSVIALKRPYSSIYRIFVMVWPT